MRDGDDHSACRPVTAALRATRSTRTRTRAPPTPPRYPGGCVDRGSPTAHACTHVRTYACTAMIAACVCNYRCLFFCSWSSSLSVMVVAGAPPSEPDPQQIMAQQQHTKTITKSCGDGAGRMSARAGGGGGVVVEWCLGVRRKGFRLHAVIHRCLFVTYYLVFGVLCCILRCSPSRSR